MDGRIRQLIFDLKEIQTGRPWIGSNFKRKLEVLSDDEFFSRPLEEMHSAAELISHLTTWRAETALKIKTGRGSISESDPSNWKSLKSLEKAGRQDIMDDFNSSLDRIIDLLAGKQDEFLQQKYYDNDFDGYYTYSWLLHGMLQHDLYHLGQIGHIVKFLKRSN